MKELENSTLIAVYGTLRQGFGNNRLLNGCRMVGSGWTDQKFQLTASGIPFVHPKKKVSKIRVEIFEIPEDRMDSIDGLEGHPTWYKRVLIPITLDNEKPVEAELYFNIQEGSTLIESGDYKEYRR